MFVCRAGSLYSVNDRHPRDERRCLPPMFGDVDTSTVAPLLKTPCVNVEVSMIPIDTDQSHDGGHRVVIVRDLLRQETSLEEMR